MNERFYLFSGCLIPTRLPFLEASSCFVLDRLGIEYEHLPDAACCVEPIGLRTMAKDTWLASAARLLAIAEEDGRDILTLCNGCYMSLREASHALRDASLRRQVNRTLGAIGREYRGTVSVRHLPGALLEREDDVRKAVARPMNLRLVSHPGCHMVRPSAVLGLDSSFRPAVVDRIASWTGARVERTDDWPSCCGGGLAGISEELSSRMLIGPSERYMSSGAAAVLTPCPFCFVQFDIKQKSGLPVLYLAELLALAMGAAPESIGMQHHRKKVNVQGM